MEKPKVNEWARRWYVLLGRVETMAAEAEREKEIAVGMHSRCTGYFYGMAWAFNEVLRNMEQLMEEEKTFLYNLVEANAFDEALGLMDLVEDSEWQQD